MNNLSTQQLILGTGLVTATGNILYINGLPFATAINLGLTGQNLYNNITGLSGQLNTNLLLTGQQAWSAANNNAINLSGNLTQTGINLINKINSTSGQLLTYISQTGSILYNDIVSLSGVLASSNQVVYITGNQSISGIKTFNGITNFNNIVNLSGNSLSGVSQIYGVDLFGNPYLSYDFNNAYLYDTSKLLSISLGDKYLYDSNGNPTISWGDSNAYSLGEVLSIDWSNRVLCNDSESSIPITLDWQNRILSGDWNLGTSTGSFIGTGQTGQFASTVNLGNTGSYLLGLITASSAGVSSINSASGALSFTGAGGITVIRNSQSFTISGNTGLFIPLSSSGLFALSTDLSSTGNILQLEINSLNNWTGNSTSFFAGTSNFANSGRNFANSGEAHFYANNTFIDSAAVGYTALKVSVSGDPTITTNNAGIVVLATGALAFGHNSYGIYSNNVSITSGGSTAYSFYSPNGINYFGGSVSGTTFSGQNFYSGTTNLGNFFINTGQTGNFYLSSNPSGFINGKLDNTNCYIGINVNSGSSNSGIGNTVLGANALNNSVAHGNTAIGQQALQICSILASSYNTAIGGFCLSNLQTGVNNTSLGYQSSEILKSGSNNTAIGSAALTDILIGNYNTAIGDSALGLLSNGNNNIAIGRLAGSSSFTGNNNIYIGNNGNSTDSNIIKVGTSQTDTYLVGNVHAQSFILSNGVNISNSCNIASSSLLNLQITGNYNILTVPVGYIFMLDTMEIITTSITTPSQAPYISFGNTSNNIAYNSVTKTTSNSNYSRHIFENPQDGIPEGTILTASVITPSTAAIHSGYAIIKGFYINK